MTGNLLNSVQSDRSLLSACTFARSAILGWLTLALVACGGSGESSSQTAPLAPALSVSPKSIKTFSFAWNDVASVTEYHLMENPDGISGYTKVATIASDTTHFDLPVFLPGRVNASYILEACNSAGCSDSAPAFVSGSLAEAAGYIKSSNTAAYQEFGWSITLSGDGNTLAVGSFTEASNATGIGGDQNDSSALNSGAVYVFTRNGSSWSQQVYLKASNAEAGDRFGYSVALADDGKTLAIGADSEDSNAIGINGDQSDNSANRSGAVYIFTRSDNNWSQQAYIKASNTEMGDQFGKSVALADDGSTLAAGAWREGSSATGIDGDQTDNSADGSGAVYVFTRNEATWSQQAYIKASNTERGDQFGFSIGLASDGNTLAVGAFSEDSSATGIDGDETDNSANASGAVYVFTRNGVDWSQQAYIKASNTDEGDQFGSEIALSGDGNTLAVGAWNEASNATGINGDQSDNSAVTGGAVYVFIRSDVTWTQQAYIKASNTEADDQFGDGIGLAADGNTLAVGAFGEDSSATGIGGDQSDNTAERSGAVYTFARNGGIWSQQAYIKAPNAEAEDWFGHTIALSGDGKTLAAGALAEDSNAIGINRDQTDNSANFSGAVYLY